MTLIYDAQRCGAVVLTSSASDESYVDPTKNSLVPLDTRRGGKAAGVCTISQADAIIIFVAKQQTRKTRDRLASRLAHKYGITSRAVTDIWNLRTWFGTTRPYWTELDAAHFARKRQRKMSNAVKAAVEPTPSQDAVSNVLPLDLKKLPEHDNTQDAVDETQRPSTGVSNTPAAHDVPMPASHQAHAASTFEACEWLIDSAIIAQEFEEISLAWHHSSARRDCMEM